MKITAKLTICFVALAVLPLAAASIVYLRSTTEFGQEMAERGKDILANRLTHELRRIIEQGAVAMAANQASLEREARFFAGDIASRMAAPVSANDARQNLDEFLLGDALPANTQSRQEIDLYKMGTFIAADAVKDQLAGTFNRLNGLSEVARTVYLRNRELIDTLQLTLESGLTATYPGTRNPVHQDPRELDWYFQTIESGSTTWFAKDEGSNRQSVSAPIQTSDGHIIGVARITVRLDGLLTSSINPSHLPSDMTAYLIVVPMDDPELLPHEVAVNKPDDRVWQIDDKWRQLLPDGDDVWLKVISDIRTGVPGVEYVERGGKNEVWAFGPSGHTADAQWHLAAVFPRSVIDDARAEAEHIVEASYMAQLKYAVLFAIFAGILATGLAIFGARSLTRPIHQLHKAARELAKCDFTTRVNVASGDELGDLAKDFNMLVPALEEQVRVKRDLLAAQEIQQHLVPKVAPDIEGFDITGTTIYCDEIGGDYQDYIALDDGRMASLIGDVTGHGVSAALMMATARAMIRTHADFATSPANLFDSVNQQLCEDSSGGRSLTLFHLLLSPGQKRFNWISAGHEPALMYDPAKDTFTALEGEDIPLGVDQNWAFKNMSGTFPDKGILIAYTDGVREAANPSGEAYGLDRLKAAVRAAHKQDSQAISTHILNDLATFQSAVPSVDDVSLLVVKQS